MTLLKNKMIKNVQISNKTVSAQIANIAIFGFCVRKGRNSGGASIFFPIKVKVDNISFLQ